MSITSLPSRASSGTGSSKHKHLEAKASLICPRNSKDPMNRIKRSKAENSRRQLQRNNNGLYCWYDMMKTVLSIVFLPKTGTQYNYEKNISRILTVGILQNTYLLHLNTVQVIKNKKSLRNFQH